LCPSVLHLTPRFSQEKIPAATPPHANQGYLESNALIEKCYKKQDQKSN